MGCCGYGAKGTKSTGAYDCLLIPGAEAVNNGAMAADCQAGGLKGLAVVTGTTAATVCSKLILVIIYKNITRLLGLAGLFEYLSIGVLSQKRSNKIHLYFFENIKNSPLKRSASDLVI